jgi:outer membrane receptor protein involved in Fe transport
VGTNVRIAKRLFVNAALWAMDLESELVYVGDEGVFEPSGKTRRIGVDVSARLQVFDWMFLDGDVNLAQPRFLNEPEGANYVPLAPPVTSIAGINVKSKNGITGSLRYRYLGDRPAIEDNSIIAKGYFVTDAVLSYNHKSKYQLGMMIENLFDERWKEAQFAAESRLKGEAESVNEIHFTPGTPFNLRGNFTFYF